MSLRERLHPRRLVAGPPPPPPPAPLPPGGGQALQQAELAERRETLAHELAELQWDLGGLAYEMAIRDHFRLDVLTRQAARLQEVDARLGEIEHLLRLDTTGAAGACPQCGTLYARGALFCSRCAFQLVATSVALPAALGAAAPPAAAEAPAGTAIAPVDAARPAAAEAPAGTATAPADAAPPSAPPPANGTAPAEAP